MGNIDNELTQHNNYILFIWRAGSITYLQASLPAEISLLRLDQEGR